MRDILVSIIIPAFNAGQFIEKCLTSICNQTYRNLEIIVTDDASTDCSVSIVQNMQEKDSRIFLIKLEENVGASTSRQIAVEHSNGELVTFVDSDDWYCADDAIEKIVDIYIRNDVDCIMYAYRTIHKHMFSIKHPFRAGKGLHTVSEIAEVKANVPSPCWHYLWNKCYKGDLLRNSTLKFQPNLRLAEDVRFNEDFLRCGKKFYVMKNSFFYDYNCCNINQVTRKRVDSSLENAILQFKCYKEELSKLLSDYAFLEVSDRAINGLYKQFFYNVCLLKKKEANTEWAYTLYELIAKDKMYMQCRDKLGTISAKCINARANGKFIKNKIKENIKKLMNM